MRDDKLHAVVARSTFTSQNVQKPQRRTTFGSCDVERVHAVVVRSTFGSQDVNSTPFSDHFWKLRCPKSARRCGAKHVSKSKCTKHTILGPLLEVAMSKKCTPFWREAHFKVNMLKVPHVRATFGRFRCRFAWQVQGIVHLVKSEQSVRVFVEFPKTMAGVGHLKRICKEACCVAGAVQTTCS